MTRAEIRAFLNAGVNAIDSNMPFGSGRISEWNSNLSNEYPGTWYESVNNNGEGPDTYVELINQVLPQDGWPIRLHVGKLDKQDSSAAQYEQLVDDCDYIAQQLVHQYSQIQSNPLYSSVSITGISRTPFVKKHKDVVTGVILSFTLVDPDKTELC